ncbi:ABC transporter permease subunit [Paenibacillus sp. LMG 31458]|uniref:ABC transporter permease subunit n=1 Tax=Paenibacillus phytorum TaxID=2654977 RepID=A0ABX1Y568_9BACL|nr:ABC transporter permease subunit [Paenibacillus phytorum]NOU74989.1 ABC transporter permease subunit [Paenibacillus phytorum]
MENTLSTGSIRVEADPVKKRNKIGKDFLLNKYLYLMILPVIVYYVTFNYIPMYSALIAFKDYNPMRGVGGSEWVGFTHFTDLFQSFYLWRILKNTIILSVYSLLFEFPAPIILALFINEVKHKLIRKFVQSSSYLPYFISLVVICGMIKDFTNSGGVVNSIITFLGGDGNAMLEKPELFRPIYVLSEIWQKIGWESIIYIAALMNIDQDQYEAARIDGANRFKQMLYVTLPGLLPTITIMFIIRMGNIMNVGYEKILLLYNPAIFETSDVINTYVFRKGILEFDWSYSAAVGLLNSLINLVLLFYANRLSRKISENSLW